MIKIGVVGLGAIGSQLARYCQQKLKGRVKLVGVIDVDTLREQSLRRQLGVVKRYNLVQLSKSCDLIIEATSTQSAPAIIRTAARHAHVMVLSIGAFAKHTRELTRIARHHKHELYLPSGAVTGLDALKAARVGRMQSAHLITRKSPESLRSNVYLQKRRINLKALRSERVLFRGTAAQAIRHFPQNINIAITLGLAGLGVQKTRVEIRVVPNLKRNIHELRVQGDFGTFYTRTENRPARTNPRTSQLAVYSALATLHQILDCVKIGT